MRPFRLLLSVLALALVAGAGPRPARAAADPSANPSADLTAARALFERNLDAIRHRDRDAYLGCYLHAETLARTGPGGPQVGFDDFAAAAGEGWPDAFHARDLHLVPVEPGVVYGTYRYRVRYGEQEVAGLSERLFVHTPDGWRIAVTTAFAAPPGTPPPPRALVGATLVDGTGAAPVADAVVVLRDGKIDCAGTREKCPVPAGVEVTDLTGRFLTPGLVDSHVHFSQTGWADGRPDALDVRDRYPYDQVEAHLAAHPERFFRTDLCAGVTAVFDVGGYPWTLELPRRAENDPRAPHVRAAGPLLSTWDFWLNLPAERQFIYLADREAATAGVSYLRSRGSQAVKIWFIPVQERKFEDMEAVVDAAGHAADEAGLPLIVHATGLREAKAALRAGADLLVHSVWDRPVDQEFLDLAKANGTIYCPTLTVGRGYQRMFEAAVAGKPPTVDDPNGCVDAETLAHVAETAHLPAAETKGIDAATLARRGERLAERERTAAANLKRVAAAGIPIAMGTDAGNPLTLHGPSVYAEMEAMQAAGLAPMQVIVASTANAARAMGRAEDLGTIEPGKAADLLVLAADPTADVRAFRTVREVVRGGVLREVGELAAPPAPAAQPAP